MTNTGNYEFDEEDYMYDGQTLLNMAAGNGDVELVKLLLGRGAKVNSMDDSGETPIHWAAENGKVAMVHLLLEKGADTEAKNKWGNTPLHCASYHNHLKVMELLENVVIGMIHE